MFELKREFKTDKRLEESGKWFNINHGAKLKIARIDNKRYNEYWRSKVKEASEKSPDQKDEDALNIVIDCVARFILVDWSGICEDGNEIEYTIGKGIEYLNMKDFRNLVVSLAENRQNFLEFDAEAKAKNL